MTLNDLEIIVAFNRGCDARMLGRMPSDNPYPAQNCGRYFNWKRGWIHMDQEYGADAQWPVKPLPELRR